MPAKVTKPTTVKKVVKKTGTAQSKTQTPAAKPAPAPEPEVSSDPAVASPPSVADEFAALLATLSSTLAQVKDLTRQVKELQKHVNKEHRELEKATRGRKKKGANGDKPKRAPSGFAKPTGLSSELCTFLGVDADTELARTEVTKKITTYVKDHDLQNPENKKIILPDAKLGALLNVPSDETLTYFNLQRYMKVHFKKAVPASA